MRMTSGHDPEAARGMFLNQVQSAKCKMRSEEPCGVHRGWGIDGAVVDERSLQPEALWAAGIRPTLSDYGGWALLCGTVPPELEAHWFVRLYRLATWSGGRGIK